MQYIRLIEITNAQELTMIKLALIEEQVNFRTLFENTMTIGDGYLMGDRGVIIEVVESDLEMAKKVLSEFGIELDYDPKEDRFEFIDKLERVTENVPLLGKLRLGYRVLLLIVTSVAIIVAWIMFYTVRISVNELSGNFWCVEEIVHNEERLQPHTNAPVVILGLPEKCEEDILFHESGAISLPGFDSYGARGRWHFKSSEIMTISEVENFREIYEGEYRINKNWNGTMDLVSDKTKIRISRKY